MKRFTVLVICLAAFCPAVSFSSGAKHRHGLDANIARFVGVMRAEMASDDKELNRKLEAHGPTRVAVASLKPASGASLVIIRVTGRMWCGATGMCTTMVLRPRGKTFDILYNDSARAPVRVLTTSTHGHPDLSVILHEDWQTNYDIRLRYDGKRYVYADKVGGYDGGKKIKQSAGSRVLIGDETGMLLEDSERMK